MANVDESARHNLWISAIIGLTIIGLGNIYYSYTIGLTIERIEDSIGNLQMEKYVIPMEWRREILDTVHHNDTMATENRDLLLANRIIMKRLDDTLDTICDPAK